MLTLDSMDAYTPSFKISESVAFGLNNFEHASDITDEMALEF